MTETDLRRIEEDCDGAFAAPVILELVAEVRRLRSALRLIAMPLPSGIDAPGRAGHRALVECLYSRVDTARNAFGGGSV